MVSIRPGQDLSDCQLRQVPMTSYAPILRQQLGQSPAAAQSAATVTQGMVDYGPGVGRLFVYFAGFQIWPLVGSLVMGVGPGQNLRDGQFWPRGCARMPRRSIKAWRGSYSPADRGCRCPGPCPHSSTSPRAGAMDTARHRMRPLARPLAMRVRPNQDLFNRQSGQRARVPHSSPFGQELGQ